MADSFLPFNTGVCITPFYRQGKLPRSQLVNDGTRDPSQEACPLGYSFSPIQSLLLYITLEPLRGIMRSALPYLLSQKEDGKLEPRIDLDLCL